ncbi:MAG: RNA recognition motif domain-containing protein [Luteolibacter sp.]
MSNATQHSRQAGEGRRRRSRGGKNRNRQQQDGRSDGGKNLRQDQGPRPSRGRAKPPVKLTWWQKLLKAIGLYKEPARPARPASTAGAPKEKPQAPKSNVRNARGSGDARAADKPAAAKRPSRGGDPSTVESARLYVGNLSYDVTEQDLQELFKGVGGVRNVEIIYNRSTHRSKGYGFVEMLHKDEALRAVEVLHDQPFMGRKLNVSGAKSKGQDEREEREDGAGGDRIVSLAPLPAANPKAQAADEPAAEESSESDTGRRSEVA